jgi:type VI protein secretion system component VasK
MLPIASSNGPAFIGVVVVGAALLLGWLLRGESRDEAEAKAEQKAKQEAKGVREAQREAAVHHGEEAMRKADEDA